MLAMQLFFFFIVYKPLNIFVYVAWPNGRDQFVTDKIFFYLKFQVQPTFSTQEMTRRQDMLRRHMETTGLDACVFTSYHNVFYFSDFLYCKFGRNYGYIVTPKKAISVSAGKYIKTQKCWNKSYIYMILQLLFAVKHGHAVFCYTSFILTAINNLAMQLDNWGVHIHVFAIGFFTMKVILYIHYI